LAHAGRADADASYAAEFITVLRAVAAVVANFLSMA